MERNISIIQNRLAVIVSACVLVLGMSHASAAISAGANLSSNDAMVGEAITLQVQVSDDQKEDMPWPEIGGLDRFQVSKSTSTSSSSQTTIVNGHISQSNAYITTFVYTLTAQQPGTYMLGPIRYAFKDFSQDLGGAKINITKSIAGLTTQSMLSKRKAYVGEQVLYTLRILPKEGVQSMNLPQDMQKLIGQKFYFDRLEKTIEPKVETINGQQVKVFDIHIALFPLLAGPASLEGIPVDYQVVRQNNRPNAQSMFDAFFGGGASVVTQKTIAEPMRMEVLPLPSGAPVGFTGSVGEYSISAKTDKTSTVTGDAVTLTVTIRGNGQPKSITKPILPELKDFEVFDPEESSSVSLQGNTEWTTKTFKYALIPHRQGAYTLEGIVFPYFDPRRGAYVKTESSPISLQVGAGREETSPQTRALTQREIADLGSDIRHIKTDVARLENEDNLPYHHFWFGGLLLLPPLAFAGALALRRRRDKLGSNAAFLRKTQAASRMRKRLKQAQQAFSSGKPAEFYHELSEAVMGLASDALNQEFRGMRLDEARETLAQHGAKPETAEAYESLMQRCDFGQFAGLKPTETELRSDLDAAAKLLEQLDKELK